MQRLKDQDWSNMTNRDIAEVISKMRPRLWFRAWMRLQKLLFKYSKRWRRHHFLNHTTHAPEHAETERLSMEDIRRHLEDMQR